MTNNPQIYHGEWWVPAPHDRDLCSTFLEEPKKLMEMGLEPKYKGTLTYYEDKDSTLELYHYPSDLHAKHYSPNEVMWGKDANGNIFTLFNVILNKDHYGDFTKIEFSVDYILIGEHVISLNDTRFNICKIKFPYLRNWAFQNMIKGQEIYLNQIPNTSLLLKTLLEKDIYWRLWQEQTIERPIHDLTIKQITTLEIEAVNALSVWSYMRHIEEFAQFLSIALYCEQNPIEIKFINRNTNRVSILLFKKETSFNPGVVSLIKFGILKDKLPIMLNTWHENYEKMSPISSYLIRSLQKKNSFDVPDFLIIAQALDGYHKRFVNSKSLINHKKYEDGIKILLKQFKDVDYIQKCRINPQELTQSRDKYSHLLTDEDKPLAVEGEDLYWLTEKCKILLTCCILNMLGLTNKEINLCCEQSPISQIIDSFPPEWD